MRIIWLCNLVIPMFSDVYGIKKNPFEGWMTGMYEAIKHHPDVEIAFCFPIIDQGRLKDGEKDEIKYYSFLFDAASQHDYGKYANDLEDRFVEIIEDYQPDLIHIWGTEYIHTLCMVRAANKKGLGNKVLIHIQGLVSVYADHYVSGVPVEYYRYKSDDTRSFVYKIEDFSRRGVNEVAAIRESGVVLGRTVWDEACTKWMNTERHYYHCAEILRKQFYEKAGTWKKHTDSHRIFMSQGTYPVKGLHFMLKAVSELMMLYEDVELFVAGVSPLDTDSEYKSYIEDLINTYDLREKIHFTGVLQADQMIGEYLKADVYVMPSTIENSPNSLIEAMMMGVPVVASYVGGIQDIITNEREGLTYPCDEPYLLAYQISRIFDGTIDVKELSANETKRALAFAPSDSSKELLDIYHKINVGDRF